MTDDLHEPTSKSQRRKRKGLDLVGLVLMAGAILALIGLILLVSTFTQPLALRFTSTGARGLMDMASVCQPAGNVLHSQSLVTLGTACHLPFSRWIAVGHFSPEGP